MQPPSKPFEAELCDQMAGFLLRWLSVRGRDPGLAEIVAELTGNMAGLWGSLAAEARREFGRRFLEEFRLRLRCLEELERRWAPGVPSTASETAQAHWRRAARLIAMRCDESDPAAWPAGLLQLSEHDTQLLLAMVSQALDEAADRSRCPRPVLAALHRLRSHDEAPFRHLTIPPAPGTTWDSLDYLVRLPDEEPSEPVRSCLFPLNIRLAEIMTSPDPAPPGFAAPSRRVQSLIRAWSEGWPVSRTALVSSLEELNQQTHDAQSDLSALASQALEQLHSRSIDPGSGRERDPNPQAEVGAHSQMAELLADVIDRLLAETEPEAREFGGRLQALCDGRAPDPEPEQIRRLLGCLVFLDELGAGSGRSAAWQRPAREQLKTICRQIKGCEILDEQLLGRPVHELGGEVIAITVSGRPELGERLRIVQVERPGYALILPDGSRFIVTPARVRLAAATTPQTSPRDNVSG